MSNGRPIRVFTDVKLKEGNKVASDSTALPINVKKMQEALTPSSSKDRQISVTGVGELTLAPDRFSAIIKCQASKDSVQDAKNSVMRRADYIIQTLQNSALKETDYHAYQHVTYSDSLAHVYYEVEAHFTDLHKCQSITNFLAEKLGPGVTVTLPQCYHAQGSMDKLRRQAGMLAIHNARQKALEMAKVLHLYLGPVLQVQEIGNTESDESSKEAEDVLDVNSSIQQRVAEATVSVCSKVAMCFQLKPLKSKKN